MDYDKKLHLGAGFAVGLIAFYFTRNIGFAIGLALLAGLAKEAFDWLMNWRTTKANEAAAAAAEAAGAPIPMPDPMPHSVELADVIFTVMGGAVGALAGYVIGPVLGL
jgi:hypothetical protein